MIRDHYKSVYKTSFSGGIICSMWPFKRSPVPDADGFCTTAVPEADLAPATMRPVTVAGQALILARLEDGALVAFARHCPHAAADLARGELYGRRITCPDHGWKFDVRSGRIVSPADEVCRLACHAVAVRDGVIHVQVTG
jgi:nitrite reductase/ring-hydroxylating ferredoxin subunit